MRISTLFGIVSFIGAACCGASMLWDMMEFSYVKAAADLAVLFGITGTFFLYMKKIFDK